MAFEVGSDIEAMCNPCGDVWHVVVAKIGDKITKVQCKQCGKQHRFKPTGEAPDANLNPVRRKVESSGPKTTRARAKPVAAGIVHDPDKPTRDYGIAERFAVGEQIQHKKFGPGVVCAIEDSKIRVNFTEGTKVLLHNKR